MEVAISFRQLQTYLFLEERGGKGALEAVCHPEAPVRKGRAVSNRVKKQEGKCSSLSPGKPQFCSLQLPGLNPCKTVHRPLGRSPEIPSRNRPSHTWVSINKGHETSHLGAQGLHFERKLLEQCLPTLSKHHKYQWGSCNLISLS